MKLTILGTGNAMVTKCYNTCFAIENDGHYFLVDGGGDPFVNTSGSFVVRINYSQSVQAITVANGGGGGASAEDVANAVWDRDLSTHTTSGSAGKSISDILKKVKKVLNILFFK